MYTQLARGVKTWVQQNDPSLGSQMGYGGAFGTRGGKPGEVPDLMHYDLGGSRGQMRPGVQYNVLQPLTAAEQNAMPAYIPLLGDNQVPLDGRVASGAGTRAPVAPMQFGGGFGGMGGEMLEGGWNSPFANLGTHPDFESRIGEQPGRDLPQFTSGPEVGSSPLGRGLGLDDLFAGGGTEPEVASSPLGRDLGLDALLGANYNQPGIADEWDVQRPLSERAPSAAAEEMQRRYGGVKTSDIGPPQYSGFEQPYGPSFAPGAYTREQFANHADYTAQDQAERLVGQREHAGQQIANDPELRHNVIATVLAEMGENQTDENRVKFIETFLNRLSANKDTRNPDYSQGMYKMLGYRDASGEITGPEGDPIQQSTNRNQYYEPFRYVHGEQPAVLDRGYGVMQRNPDLAAHVGDLLDAAIKTGTNVSNLATENSSGRFAREALASQSPNSWVAIGNDPELFSRKDLGTPAAMAEHGSPAVYRNWLAGLMPTGWQWEQQPRSSIPDLPARWR